MEKPKVLIELYVASPPTFKCRRMIELAEQMAEEYPGKIKINIYYRGQPIPDEATTGFRASLKSMGVPSIFIDGRWVASTNPPPIDRVRKHIEEDLKAIEEYVKKHGEKYE
ncbi:MAG: hypothetical protein J7J33_00240 [Caldisericia bacterium]|nr:hypothetical protein [Caldisericia bacterium]